MPVCVVPPLTLAKVRVFIGPGLLQCDEKWAAAGTWNDVFDIEPHQLVEAREELVACPEKVRAAAGQSV